MKKFNKNIYLLYSVTFFLFILIALLPQQISSKTLFSFGLFTDGIKQHIVFMYDFVSVVKELFISGDISIFRYNIGLGADLLISYSFYSLFDPLTIIAYIIPIKYIEFSYYLIAIIRLYLSGVFIILLAKKFNIKNNLSLLLLSIFYVFNVTTIYTAFRHPMFTNGPMLLPLIILGAEKVLRKESPLLLILSSFLGIITQFYFFVYTSFAFEVFIIIRLFFNLKEKNFKTIVKQFFSINILYCLGVFIGGFVLFPQLLATLNSARVGSKGLILYDAFDLLTFQTTFLIPIVGHHYTSGIGNIISLFIIFVYIFRNKKSWLSIYFIILSSLVFISLFGYAINIFAYVNNRWTYIINLPASLMIGKVFDDYNSISIKEKNNAIKAILSIIILILSFSIIYLFTRLDIYIVNVISYVLFIYLSILFIKKLWNSNYQFPFLKHLNIRVASYLQIVYCFLVLISLSLYYHNKFNTTHGLDSFISNYELNVINQDKDFFRVDQNVYALNTTNFGNDNIISGYNAPYSYNSMSSKEIVNLLEYLRVPNLNITAGYNGFQNRLRLNILNQVKYLIIYESDHIQIPYGYELVDTIKVKKGIPSKNLDLLGDIETINGQTVYENAYIYKNKHFLQFGNMFYNYTTINDLLDVNPVDREKIMFNSIVLNEEYNKMEKFESIINTPCVQINDFIYNNINLDNNKLIVLENGGSLSFSIPNVLNEELFIEVIGLTSLDPNKSFTTTYSTHKSTVIEKSYGYGSNVYIDNTHQLVNLGLYNEEKVDVNIIFDKGEYTFDKIFYYLNPINDIIERVNTLNKSSLNNLEFNNKGFSGNISAEDDGMLFLSIPYSKGFKAYVDGIQHEIHQVNIGYMGVFVEKGDHLIELKYETPGLKLGIIISIVSLCTTVSLLIVNNSIKIRRKRNKKDYEDIKEIL